MASQLERPPVSIVLPIRNEEKDIVACIDNLLHQDYPHQLIEILIVDGMSSDNTRTIVSQMIRATPHRVIKLLDNPQGIVPSALNVGIRSAMTDVIIRMDGHTVPDRTYISRCVKTLVETKAANVGGLIRATGTTAFGSAVALAQTHPLGAGDAKFHYSEEPEYVDTVYMGAFNKGAFERAGLFDESMVRNQDYEMNIRIRKTGGRIYLDPGIVSSYRPRDTPRKLWKQYFEYGWWKVETLRRHPDSLRWRQFIPVAFVVALLVLSPLAFLPFARFLLAVQVSLYVSAIGYATAQLSRKQKHSNAVVARFPLALILIHVSWGLGFLLSLVSRGRFPFRAGPPQVPTLQKHRPSRA